MDHTQLSLPVDDGLLNVLDFGGDGPQVLFVHTPGYCASSWLSVAAELGGVCHSYALDLPGHGGSTTSARDAQHVWRTVAAAIEGLGLTRPVLVGLDHGAFYTTAIAHERPDLVGALVSLSGASLHSREELSHIIGFATSPELASYLVDRFKLGEIGRGEPDRQALMGAICELAVDDWALRELQVGLRAEMEQSFRDLTDGYWQHLPTIHTVGACYRLDLDDGFPEAGLQAQVSVPTWLILTEDGAYVDTIERARALASRDPLVTLIELTGANGPHYQHAAAVAQAIVAACAAIAVEV